MGDGGGGLRVQVKILVRERGGGSLVLYQEKFWMGWMNWNNVLHCMPKLELVFIFFYFFRS